MPCDNDPLDLRCSLTDVQELLVSVVSLDGIFLHQPISAVELDGVIGNAIIRFGTDEFRHGRFLGEGAFGVGKPAGLVEQ